MSAAAGTAAASCGSDTGAHGLCRTGVGVGRTADADPVGGRNKFPASAVGALSFFRTVFQQSLKEFAAFLTFEIKDRHKLFILC